VISPIKLDPVSETIREGEVTDGKLISVFIMI
jgi:hypothetical protein